jgi:hypothetical protein
MFGGFGYNAATGETYLSDMWKISGGQFTYVWGPMAAPQNGNYGVDAGGPPFPGSRRYPAVWANGAGKVWIFGGDGYGGPSSFGHLNDLWTWASGQWTLVSGNGFTNQNGVYSGTLSPGSRALSAFWGDSAGNFWVFGGEGYDGAGTSGILNDLWSYSGGKWAWASGASTVNQPSVYGTQGVPSPGNTPGNRSGAASWTDSTGKLWLFGGRDNNSMVYNDLWSY